MAKLDGAVAIVTGAAVGMGKNHCLALAREGANVAVVDLSAKRDDVVKEVEAIGRKAVGIQCDVSKSDEVQNMVQTVADTFGKIDILVNNAGVITLKLMIEMTEEDWDFVMNVNLKGCFLCCKAVLPHMIAQRSGKIVNIGSVSGRQGLRFGTHYCSSKAGIHIFTEALSKEVAEYNINVNCVAPGTIWGTHMTAGFMEFLDKDDPKKVYEETVKKNTTLGREVTPQDVSNAMLFLVSEESRNMTGYTLYVDGGFKSVLD